MQQLADSSLAASLAMFERASKVIPGGITSSVRAGGRPHPLFFERGDGPYIVDVDGNRYVDYVLGYGPLIFGHAPADINAAIQAQIGKGLTFGSQHPLEPEVARLVVDAVPGAEQVIFATTGSEAVAVAVRVARAVTGRRLVVKFEGHYHGWHDGLFAGVGYDPARSGPSTRPFVVAAAPGIPGGALTDLLVAPWNDLESLEGILADHPGEIAAIICEPVAVNGGVIPPRPGFLNALREICTRQEIILIFDEVITGFRLALGGAQEHYGVTADLTVFGKAIGGGMPLSAVTGSTALMAQIADRRLPHNGTFNGNPVALAAGSAAVRSLSEGRAEIYPRLHELGRRLAEGLVAASPRLAVRQVGPIVGVSVDTPGEVSDVRDLAGSASDAYVRLVEALLRRGVHATPRGLWYVSTAHTTLEIDATIAAAADAAREVLG